VQLPALLPANSQDTNLVLHDSREATNMVAHASSKSTYLVLHQRQQWAHHHSDSRPHNSRQLQDGFAAAAAAHVALYNARKMENAKCNIALHNALQFTATRFSRNAERKMGVRWPTDEQKTVFRWGSVYSLQHTW
jgi:hypothetical protein